MKIPLLEPVPLPRVLELAATLPCTGILARSKNNLIYLNIDDAYIHRLFPLVQSDTIKMPAYFGEQGVGAHISVIYPEEHKEIKNTDLGQEHHFLVKDLVAAQIHHKNYAVLLVESPSLLQLRRRQGLPELLCFKGYSIGFHITIGVKSFLQPSAPHLIPPP